jgi:hypothetical protein
MYRGLHKRINLGLLAVLEEREELRQEELRQEELRNMERVAAMVRARQYRGITMRRKQ